MSHALPLYRVEQVRAIERAAAAHGLNPASLMDRAGKSAAALVAERWPSVQRIGVLCGKGNNGGDGYVAALVLLKAGFDVVVAGAGPSATEEARAAQHAWRDAGQGVVALGGPLPRTALWIDALFGVGLSRAPDAISAQAIAAVREQGVPVLALDVPSGLDADRGCAPGVVLPATLTLCFIAAKQGLLTATARDVVGELLIDALGVPADAFSAVSPSALAVAEPALRAALPVRTSDSHKGYHGRVLCIGGSEGMGGALALCAEAAARCGAGWVDAAGSAEAIAALRVRCPEVLGAALISAEGLDARMAVATVLALGPGLGLLPMARSLFHAALASGLPMVVDADALNLLAEAPCPMPQNILTPHPGEAGRLLGVSTSDVQNDRYAALDALVQRFECAVVLKGAGTLVGAPGQVTRVVQAGNAAMASAGMGDVLTGVIAALRAQGLPAFDAAWVGALAHSAAGDRAAKGASRGLLASDLLPELRVVLNARSAA